MTQDDEALRRRIRELRAQGMDNATIKATMLRERSPQSPSQNVETVPRENTPNPLQDNTQRGYGNAYKGLARGLLNGLTFGAGDEIEGAARALVPGGMGYREGTDHARRERDAFRQATPSGAFISELVGGMLPVSRAGNAIAKTAKALTLPRQVGRAAATGAGVGATAGFLSGDEGFGSRVGGATGGAILGAPLGGAAPVVAAGVRRAAPSVAQSLRDAVSVASNTRGAVRMSRNPSELERLGTQYFGKWGKPEQRAVQLAVTRAERDGIDLVQALEQVAPMTEGGRPVVAADMGKASTRRLLAASELDAPEQRNFLDTRTKNRPARMGEDFTEGTGAMRVDLGARPGQRPGRVREIEALEGPEMDRLWGEVRRENAPVPLSAEGRDALTQPATRTASRRAPERAANDPDPTQRTVIPAFRQVDQVEEIPLGTANNIARRQLRDGRIVYEGGNEKFSKLSTERLEADYRQQLERIERAAEMQNDGVRMYTRETNDGKWSGFIPKNEYGRGLNAGNVAERQARELEAELAGRYKGMDPDELAQRPTYAFGEDGPIWTQMEDVAEGAAPRTRSVVTGSSEEVADALDMRTIRNITEDLDNQISAAEAAGDNNLVRKLVDQKKRLQEDAKAASMPFREALNLSSRTSRRQEAVEEGKRLGTQFPTANDIRASREGLSPLEDWELQNAAAEVQRQQLVDGKIGPALNNPGRDERLSALYGDDAAAEIERRVGYERTMLDTERAGLGSNTANKLADREDIADGALDGTMAAQLSRGAVWPAVRDATVRAGVKGYNKYLLGVRGETASNIGRLLLGGREGPAQLEEVLRLLQSGRTDEANRLARRLQAAAGASSVTGREMGR